MALSEEDKKEILDMVASAVKMNVNGKIDNLTTKIKPMTDILEKWMHIRAQFYFFGAGVLAIAGAIQAVQTLWAIANHWITFK